MGTHDQKADGSILSGEEREVYVERMFDRIAQPYDRLNRILSLGRDQAWRRRVVRHLSLSEDSKVCDLGTGTGDLALTLKESLGPAGRVVGVDLSGGMLAVAEEKRKASGVEGILFARGSAAEIPVPENWADGISMGWVLRNVGDRGAVYAEVQRALRPGGRFVVIDMSRPRFWPSRAGFWVFRHLMMPLIVRLAGAEREAFRYLATSTDRFPRAPELADEMRAAGFASVEHHGLMGGSIAVHVATASA